MISAVPLTDNTHTKQLRDLISRVHDAPHCKDSLYPLAAQFFKGELQQQIVTLSEEVASLQRRLDDASRGARSRIEDKLKVASTALKAAQQQLEEERLQRVRLLKKACRGVLSLLEGDNKEESRAMAARSLGTIALISPTYGPKVAQLNARHKHIYKAILALLLLQQLLQNKLIKNSYVLSRVDSQYTSTAISPAFIEEVQLPLIAACLLQDIGLQHPAAQRILTGVDGSLDPYRVLPADEREALLEICYTQSQRFVTEGLGLDTYIGNSKTERELFLAREQENQDFILHLLQAAIAPEDGIGNLLKIPQVYTSVVLPSKSNYHYEQIAKVSALLKAGVEKGWYPAKIVDNLLQITGIFPQGFGITYIPKDSDRRDLDRYEYAIVNGLYPFEPEQPICRQVTRNLKFNNFGINLVIAPDNNLFFPLAQQKLEKISEERLREILLQLVSNFEERMEMDLIPRCWHPDEFFHYSKNQNLWNRTDTIRN